MKKLLLLINLFTCHLLYAQDRIYTINYQDENFLNNCNVFATPVTVDNYVHSTTVGHPQWPGTADRAYLVLPALAAFPTSFGTEYQVAFPFKKGYFYYFLIHNKASADLPFPYITLSLNDFEKSHYTDPACGALTNQPVPESMIIGSSSHEWSDAGYNTGVLTQNYSYFAVGARPSCCTGLEGYLHIQRIEIWEFCGDPAIPTGLSATTTPLSTGYGYTLNFTPVSDAVDYQVEWFDVTTNTLASTFTVNGPGYLHTGFTTDHIYKFRVRARNECNHYSQFSDWSADLNAPIASCANGPLSSTLSLTFRCGTPCNFAIVSWPDVPGAVQYKIEYHVVNVSLGISGPFTTVYSTLPRTTITIGPNAGFGWSVEYRIAVDCGSGFGNFSGMSPRYAIP